MGKKLLVTLVIVILLYPFIAWSTGWLIEHRNSESLAETTDQVPWITITDNKYHRGWYTSEQDLTLTLFAAQMSKLAPMLGGNSAALAKGIPVTIHSVIHHGPVCGWTCYALARVDSHFVLSNEAKATVAQVYGNVDPLSLTTRLGFLGGGTATFSNAPLAHVTLPNGKKLTWDGFKLVMDYTRHHDSYKMDGQFPHLLVEGTDGERMELKSMTITADSKRLLRYFYSGNFDFGIDSIGYAGVQGSSPFLLQDAHYVGQATVNGGFIDYGLRFDTGAVQASGLALKDAHLDFTFKHLDIETLATMNDKMRALYKVEQSDADTDPKAMMNVIKGQLLQLLLKQPEISLDRVGLDTADGQVLLNGKVNFPGVTAADLANEDEPGALMKKLVGDFDLSVDDSALNELPGAAGTQAQLDNMAKQGYFTHDNGRWHATIHMADGQRTFNGKPFVPAAPVPPPQPEAPAAPKDRKH